MTARSHQPWRRTAAVLAGFLTIGVLSLATDQALNLLDVDPPLSLALLYRLAYGIIGGYVTARLAPFAPIHHAVVLGMASFLASAAGAIITISLDLNAAWYPIALALIALPTAALGGVLYSKKNRDHRERSANPLLFPCTFRLPDCDDFQEPDFAAPSSSASTRPAQSNHPFRGS
jgi:hypothetical protein